QDRLLGRGHRGRRASVRRIGAQTGGVGWPSGRVAAQIVTGSPLGTTRTSVPSGARLVYRPMYMAGRDSTPSWTGMASLGDTARRNSMTSAALSHGPTV